MARPESRDRRGPPYTPRGGRALGVRVTEGEEAWQGGARQALDELEAQTEERARALAQEALPHLVESSVKALFASEGMPVPPIWVGADGALEIGDPPKGSVIEA